MWYFNRSVFKKITVFTTVLFSLLLCSGSGSVGVVGLQEKLPADQINDQTRNPDEYYVSYNSFSEFLVANPNGANDIVRDSSSFNYKSLVETKFDLKFRFFDMRNQTEAEVVQASANVIAASETNFAANATILVTKTDDPSVVIFAGVTDANGVIQGSATIPIALSSIKVTIYKEGYQQRTAIIENIANLSTVSRTMSLAMTVETLDLFAYEDSDGDFIPNVYDAFPYDSTRAFRIDAGAQRFLSVAFEDNYPGLGDGDYNDFLARYNVTQILNPQNKIVELSGSVEAVARVAGYDHRFGIIINFPGASAQVTILNADDQGQNDTSVTTAVSDFADMTIWTNTKQAFTRVGGVTPDSEDSKGHLAFFSIKFDTPIDPQIVDNAPYDPYLYIHNTTYDVHLLGKPPLVNTNNPSGTLSSGFRDGNGYPRALLVPLDWSYPKEGQDIEGAYANFIPWRESGGQTNSNWYFTPTAGKVIEQPAENFIYSEYVAQATIPASLNGGVTEAVQYSFSFDRNVSLLSSKDPRYVYKGIYAYDLVSKLFTINYTTVELRDLSCFECAPLATYPATSFAIDDSYKSFEVTEMSNDFVKAKRLSDGTELIFDRRSTFAPVDE